jgi:translation elongation factor EF-G
MGAESVLLEPFYRFEILVPAETVGRVLSDVTSMSGTFEPPETVGSDVRIRGRGPVQTFADYAVNLRAQTHGEGSMVCYADGYDLCHNAQEVIDGAAYNPGADMEQPASSVFCSHGAGVTVAWDEAEQWMHCPKMK